MYNVQSHMYMHSTHTNTMYSLYFTLENTPLGPSTSAIWPDYQGILLRVTGIIGEC